MLMRRIFRNISILAIVLLSSLTLSAQSFTKGAEQSATYSVKANGKDGSQSFTFTTKGVSFRVLGFYNNDGTVISVENVKDGKRSLVVLDDKFNLKTSTGSDGYVVGADDKANNEFEFSVHDFTDDGSAELIVAIRNTATDEISVHVLEYGGALGWYSIGEMASKGKKIEEFRVFRQTLTFKSPATNVLYTWTFHEDHFTFLSSDHVNDPEKLF